jgi:HK97 family phage major capsid protein
MQKARELRQERAKLVEQAQADLNANPEGFSSPEEQERWDKRMSDIDALEQNYRAIERRYETEAELAEKMAEAQSDLDEQRDFGARRLSAEEQREARNQVWRQYLRKEIGANEFGHEIRAIEGQTKGTNAQGGFTVPQDFLAEVQVHLKAYGGMRQVARIIRTANGQDLPIPISDDTGNTAKLIAEATAPSTTTRVPFSQVTLEAAKYQSGPIKMSMELLQDSAIDVEAFVAEMMGTRFGRITNTHFTTRSSTESSGPHGITNDSTGALAVANGTLNYDDVIDLLHKVDPAYRASGSAAWMTNDIGFSTLRKLRGSTAAASDVLVWQPSLVPGAPDTLLGYPVVINQDVPLEGTSGNKWLWFGDWSRYAIRDVMGLQVRRLDERYAEEGVSALIGFMRTDGRSILPSTTAARRPYRCIIQSTG